ncbi:MAG TPA: hypothetical protein VEU08_11315 [Vicinamibacterales bacterium]|nr:hypothetical protein [Vicinamibacterales bacterium]
MFAPLSVALLFSGAAGLIFELVWFDRAGLVFGTSVVAAAIVLSSFMGGLALGNAIAGRIGSAARNPASWYALCELTVGISGIALTILLPHLTAYRIPAGASFFLLLIPASAMGATLPLAVAALRNQDPASFGRLLGVLYGCNTVGAVSGVLLAETALIPAFGIAGSAWMAAGFNAIGAAIALTASRRDRAPATAPVPRREGLSKRLITAGAAAISCSAVAGLVLLALEVIWFRFLSMFVLTTTAAMSAILAVVLAGIAAGGLIGAWWLRSGMADRFVPAVAFSAGASVVVSYRLFAIATYGTQTASMTRVLWFAAVMALPTCIASGVLFTFLGQAVRRGTGDDAGAAATLTAANTIGAAIGPPLATFFLLQTLGSERALLALATAYAALGLAAWLSLRPYGRRERIATVLTAGIAGVAVMAILRFPLGLMSGTFVPRVAQAYGADGSRVVESREGPTESILLMQQQWMGRPVYSRLVTNGFSMSGTAIPGQRYMRYFVYWPMLMHQAPLRRILVICYGVGVTAGAAVDVPSASRIDVVEISRDVVATSDTIYAEGAHPLRDPRVAVHIEDGRHFLQTSTERFDLITGEPPPPRTPGAVNIYTREYFALVRDRLADGGMATYWLPVARPEPGTDVDTIIRAFCDVFDDCSLWNATPFDFMLVGSRAARPRFAADRFAEMRGHLAEVGFETPEQIGATFLGDAAYLRELTADTPPLTDDFPQRLRPGGRRSLSDPRYPSDAEAVARYQRVIDPLRARAAFADSPYIAAMWPPDLLAATLPWFDEQSMINRVFWEGGKPLRLVDDLDALLTRTTLRTLPLWILDSDAVKQRIAATGNDGTGTVEYMRGAQLLAARQYGEAASYFGLAERRGLRSPSLRPLIAYSLCRAGRFDLSVPIAAALQPRDDDERHFSSWMASHCAP